MKTISNLEHQAGKILELITEGIAKGTEVASGMLPELIEEYVLFLMAHSIVNLVGCLATALLLGILAKRLLAYRPGVDGEFLRDLLAIILIVVGILTACGIVLSAKSVAGFVVAPKAALIEHFRGEK